MFSWTCQQFAQKSLSGTLNVSGIVLCTWGWLVNKMKSPSSWGFHSTEGGKQQTCEQTVKLFLGEYILWGKQKSEKGWKGTCCYLNQGDWIRPLCRWCLSQSLNKEKEVALCRSVGRTSCISGATSSGAWVRSKHVVFEGKKTGRCGWNPVTEHRGWWHNTF